ncbi:MAG: hypothetical protein ACREH6_00195 [Geminicoccaceae bacterium]
MAGRRRRAVRPEPDSIGEVVGAILSARSSRRGRWLARHAPAVFSLSVLGYLGLAGLLALGILGAIVVGAGFDPNPRAVPQVHRLAVCGAAWLVLGLIGVAAAAFCFRFSERRAALLSLSIHALALGIFAFYLLFPAPPGPANLPFYVGDQRYEVSWRYDPLGRNDRGAEGFGLDLRLPGLEPVHDEEIFSPLQLLERYVLRLPRAVGREPRPPSTHVVVLRATAERRAWLSRQLARRKQDVAPFRQGDFAGLVRLTREPRAAGAGGFLAVLYSPDGDSAEPSRLVACYRTQEGRACRHRVILDDLYYEFDYDAALLGDWRRLESRVVALVGSFARAGVRLEAAADQPQGPWRR